VQIHRSIITSDAEADHRAGYVLQIPGEVLAAERLVRVAERAGAEEPLRRVAEALDHRGVVHHRWGALHVVDLEACPERHDDVGHDLADQLGQRPPHRGVETPHRSLEHHLGRDDVRRPPAVDRAEHRNDGVAGVDRRTKSGGEVDDDSRRHLEQVDGLVRS